MPQTFDVEGVGTLNFPDDATPDEIQQFLDENYNKGAEKTSVGGAFGRSLAAEVAPGAGFMAGAIPGAEVGAMIGSAVGPVGTIVGGAIGGMVTGIPAAWATSKLQKKVAETVAPEAAKEFYGELEAGEREHPWASAAGGVAALGASARTAPFKLAQLPFRLGLGGAMAAGVPLVTEQRLPTLPEFVSGVASGTIYGTHRFSKTAVPRPESPPEARSQREELLMTKAAERGLELEPTDAAPAQQGAVIEIEPGTTKGRLYRQNLNRYIEQHLPERYDEETGLNDLVEHEIRHSVSEPAKAREFWNNLSPYEQYLEKRKLHGAYYQGPALSDEQYGLEAIRAWSQLARTQSTTEFISSVMAENRTSKFLTGLQKVLHWYKGTFGKELTKQQLKRNNEIIDEVNAKVEAAKEAVEKGRLDASQIQKAAAVHGDVRAQPIEGAREVPVQEGRPGVQPQAEGRVAEEVQVPLKPQKDRSTALLKNPPVVKDVPPGSIDPDSIIPAIRLINGDVIHGWIKKNGKAATHPEIAKRYGITVEELDRKGWVSKDGKAFYEREPAAKGTLLPTEKKEGELHSTDKPEEAPPVAPAKGAQPVQATTGLATTPPGAVTPGVPAAKPTISTAFPESKVAELDALNREVTNPEFNLSDPANVAKYERWVQLSGELEAAEAAAGAQPHAQGVTAAMAIKGRASEEPSNLVAAIKFKDGHVETGRSHGDIYLKIAREGRISDLEQATLPQSKGFVDQNREFHTRNEAAKIFRDITGQDPRDPQALTSEDLADAGLGVGKTVAMTIKPQIARRAESKDKNLLGDPIGTVYHATPEDWTKYQSMKAARIDALNRKDFDAMYEIGKDWEALKNKYGGMEPAAPIEGAVAMAIKPGPGAEMKPRDVVAKIVQIVGGVGDPEKVALVEKTARLILSRPQSEWHAALTDFHFQTKALEIKNAGLKQAAEQAGMEGEDLTKALSPEALAAKLGVIDRQASYRGALYTLNQPIRSALPKERKVTKKELQASMELRQKPGGKPVSHAVRPEYYTGDWEEFWTDLHDRHPQIPEWAAREVWSDAVLDYLNNASSARLKELLRPARLEKRFLGEGLLRTVLEPDVDPILREMEKSPSPQDLPAFKRFWAARDMTPEQALQEMQRLRDLRTQEMREMKEYTEPKGEVLTPAERARREAEWHRGRAINRKRRDAIINALSQWYIQPSKAPERTPMRRTVTLDDVWFERRGEVPAYSEYDKQQGTDASFLKKTLAQGGIVKGKTGTTTHSITVVVDPTTGDYHALSTYARGADNPRIYDPAGMPGSKTEGYVDVNQLLAKYRVVGSFLVKDPVYNFHQRWRSEPGRSGQDKFDAEIGAVARSREQASNAQWMKYIRESEAERKAERERIRQERFFGKVEEEEVTGELKSKPETTAEEEKAAAEAEVEETAREEEPTPSIREQIAKQREEEGGKPWEEGEEFDPERGRQSRMTEAAMQTWQAGRGRGAGALGLFQSDLRKLAEASLGGAEAESVYQILREYNVSHPDQIQKVLESIQAKRRKTGVISGREISALYGLDKIANRIYERMSNSPYEKSKTAHLPPIPKDTEYVDMSPGEKEHYIAREALKYRALLRTFHEVYELAKEVTTPGKRAQAALAKGVSLPEDIEAFRTRALDQYGDTARRDLESAALSAQRAPEISGQRTLLAGARAPVGSAGLTGTPRTLVGRVLPQAILPGEQITRRRPQPPASMLPASEAMRLAGGAQKAGQPPLTAFTGMVAEKGPTVERPMGEYLRETYAAQRGGKQAFVPSAPSRHELLTRPLPKKTVAMAIKPDWISEDYKYLKEKFPGVPWLDADRTVGAYWIDPSGRIGQVSGEHAYAAEKILKAIVTPEEFKRIFPEPNWDEKGFRGWESIGYPSMGELFKRGWARARVEDAGGNRYHMWVDTGKYPLPDRIKRSVREFAMEYGTMTAVHDVIDVTGMPKRESTIYSPETSAMTIKGYGVADRYQEEMRAQGRTTYTKEELEKIPKAQLIAMGRDLVLSGEILPEKEMRQAERGLPLGGYMSTKSLVAFRYWGYRLQSMADAIANNPQLGVNSKAYQFAEKQSSEWQRRLRRTGKQTFARMGHGLQGWNQIGPDDMKSTTFIRNYVKKARAKLRGAKEEDLDDLEDVELDAETQATVDRITRQVTGSEEGVDGLSMAVGMEIAKEGMGPKLDPGQQSLADVAEAQAQKRKDDALAHLKAKQSKKPSAMAKKGDAEELAKLPEDESDALVDAGMKVLMDLSKAGNLTDERWLSEMKTLLQQHNLSAYEPYLPLIRAVSQNVRDEFLNNFIGTGSSTKDAREIFTRKRPTIEASKAAIRRALEVDPTGNRITPAEAFHVWNYLKIRFFDVPPPDGPIRDFKVIRTQAAAELGIKDELLGTMKTPYSQLRLFRAISAKRSMKVLTDALIQKMREDARIKSQALNWMRNQQYPEWLRAVRLFPRLFFFDKILGHGLVPMITHAPMMMFTPQAWSVYFGTWRGGKFVPGAWHHMYQMTFGTQPIRRALAKVGIGKWEGMKGADLHRIMMDELRNHENFEMWRASGLQIDPFKYTDDYQIEALQKVFGDRLQGWIGGRGFDALKTLRFAMAEKWYNSLPQHLKNKESARLIADSVNHSTGIVKTKFHEVSNWLMFAPKLEASRWAYLFKDTAKAIDYIRNWKTATLEQRAWAKSELKQKALMVGWYYGMLALNQAFLKMSDSKEDINVTDPKKPDFMQFKIAGFRVGVMSPIIGVFRMLSNALHIAVGERTKYEQLNSRQKQLWQEFGRYGRGKMSPLASFTTDIATQEDFAQRKLPWSSETTPRSKLIRGIRPYGTGEYLAQTFLPIPAEEAVRDTFRSMGMPESQATKLIRTMIIAGGMSATGARIVHMEE